MKDRQTMIPDRSTSTRHGEAWGLASGGAGSRVGPEGTGGQGQAGSTLRQATRGALGEMEAEVARSGRGVLRMVVLIIVISAIGGAVDGVLPDFWGNLGRLATGMLTGEPGLSRSAPSGERQGAAVQRQLAGSSTSPNAASWQVDLSQALDAAARADDNVAETHFMNALFETEKFGESDTRLTNVLDNLAYFYGERGRYDEAMPYYLRALEGYRATVGEEHENFIGIERRIAYAYRDQGAYPAALEHLNAAIDAARAVHGPDYVGIAYGYRESADIRRMAGDEAGAREDYQRALVLAERSLGKDHPVVVQLRRAIGQ